MTRQQEVWDRVASEGFEVVSHLATSPDTVAFTVKLPEGAASCCKIVALTEGDGDCFYVTLKKRDAPAESSCVRLNTDTPGQEVTHRR